MLNSEKAMFAMNDIDDLHLESARQMLGYRTGKEAKHNARRRIITLALVAALILALGAAAYAIGVHSGFFQSVFGKRIQGRDAFDVEIKDENGNVMKTEHYPAIKREEVDEELAENLTGAYIASIGQSAAAGNYSFTIKEALVDENGIGAFTVHVYNPDGHGLVLGGNYGPGGHQPFSWRLFPEGDEMHFLDERDYIQPDSLNETEADIVFYFTPFTPLPKNTGLIASFSVFTEGAAFQKWPKAELTIPAQEKLPSRTLTGDGTSAYLSPVGLVLHEDTHERDEAILESIRLVFEDVTEYTLIAPDLVNFSVASRSPDGLNVYYSFNRLCDAERVKEIYISSSLHGSETVSRTLR